MNPYSSGVIGNTMTKLAGIKNVRPRRVIPGAEFIQELEDANEDVSGTAPTLPNFSNFQTQNEPEPDLGGELTPQSYDVRANSITSEGEPEKFKYFSRLGKALASYVSPLESQEQPANMDRFNSSMPKNNALPRNAPPKESLNLGEYGQAIQGFQNPQNPNLLNTPEIPPENINLTNAPEAKPYKAPYRPSLFNGIRQLSDTLSDVTGTYIAKPILDVLSPTQKAARTQENEDLLIDQSLQAQGLDPAVVRQEKQNELNQNIEQAMEQPWIHSAYGSASEVASHPALQEEFKEITGMDYTEQLAAETSKFEQAMQGVEDALNGNNTQLDEQSEAIKQRILNNQMTDSDKFFIGMALLLPLLIGGLFGKEAGLGALSGTAKGYADILGNREKNIRTDEASLLDIGKQKTNNIEKLANLGLQKAKLPGELQKNLPEDQRKHLRGLKEASWIDPKTGKEEKGTEILPGLVAKSNFVQTEKGLDNKRKQAEDLTEVKSYVGEINDLTNDAIEILEQLQDPNIFSKYATAVFSGATPGSLGQITQDIMFKGRKQNAGVLLEEILGLLANAYAQAKQIGQLDRAAQVHIRKIIENPTSTLLTPENAKSQLLEVRDNAQKGLVRDAVNKGFVPEFLISDMEQSNNELFGKLNAKENAARLETRKRQALK